MIEEGEEVTSMIEEEGEVEVILIIEVEGKVISMTEVEEGINQEITATTIQIKICQMKKKA